MSSCSSPSPSLELIIIGWIQCLYFTWTLSKYMVTNSKFSQDFISFLQGLRNRDSREIEITVITPLILQKIYNNKLYNVLAALYLTVSANFFPICFLPSPDVFFSSCEVNAIVSDTILTIISLNAKNFCTLPLA